MFLSPIVTVVVQAPVGVAFNVAVLSVGVVQDNTINQPTLANLEIIGTIGF